MIDFETACALVRGVGERTGSELIPLRAAFGRVLAEPIVAAMDSPRQDVSAMDGYALRDSDLAGLPVQLDVAGEAFAGNSPPPPIEPGICFRIFTVGPLAQGTDRVVI